MANGSFEIYLAWSDRRLTVAPQITALQALQAAGIPVEPGCQVGGCGLCAMPYVEGDIIHKDACLSVDQRARYFCPCVSRAASQIVLAL
jgi:ferredoxin